MSAPDRAVDPSPVGLLSPGVAFGLCVAILASLTACVFLMKYMGGYLEKGPVALHRVLSELRRDQLAPYSVNHAEILPDEVTDSLGTKEYIQWYLEDPRRPVGDPLRYVGLFVTYYTGGRTQVPHTPERCHLGAGWSASQSPSILRFEIAGPDGGRQPVEAAALQFNKPGLVGEQKRTVVYTFYVNGAFTCDRTAIRLRLGDPRVSKCFYSKVEVSFTGRDGGVTNPDPQEAADAARQVFEVVLPVLVRDHWPRYEELQKTDAPVVRRQAVETG